jgi:hypothetical protein
MSIVQEDTKLVGETTAEKISKSRHIFLHDTIVLLLLCGSFDTLLWQGTNT